MPRREATPCRRRPKPSPRSEPSSRRLGPAGAARPQWPRPWRRFSRRAVRIAGWTTRWSPSTSPLTTRRSAGVRAPRRDGVADSRRAPAHLTLRQDRLDYDARFDGLFPPSPTQRSPPRDPGHLQSKQPSSRQHHLLKAVSRGPGLPAQQQPHQALFFLHFVALLVNALSAAVRGPWPTGAARAPLYRKSECRALSERILETSGAQPPAVQMAVVQQFDRSSPAASQDPRASRPVRNGLRQLLSPECQRVGVAVPDLRKVSSRE